MAMTTVYNVAEQLSLLDVALAPAHNGSVTSVAAAVAAIPKVGPQKRRILAYLAERPDGEIQQRIADALGLPESTVNPRIREMADDHWVEPSVNVRNTKYGKAARVWEISDKGRAVLEAGS